MKFGTTNCNIVNLIGHQTMSSLHKWSFVLNFKCTGKIWDETCTGRAFGHSPFIWGKSRTSQTRFFCSNLLMVAEGYTVICLGTKW